ncbi:hypothetical protein [Escherichia coli]|uniref:hypothetical protein n=1 Tax=Escherichia coli TaxID=562 RepID=UPI000CFD340E|nr:hypothetical protein [Escherichia coli]
MKIRIVNFKKEHVDDSMVDKFPYDIIYNGAVLSAHFPSIEEIMGYGADEKQATYAQCKMATEGSLIIDGLDGFENDPIVIRSEDYEIVDREGEAIPEPDPEILLEMLLTEMWREK